MRRTRRGILYVAAALLLSGPMLMWLLPRLASPPRSAVVVPVAVASTARLGQLDHGQGSSPESLWSLAQREPLALARLGQERYARGIRDYRCVLIKQERLHGELSDVQQVEVRFRKDPLCVYMLWLKNAAEVKRALFKGTDPDYVDEDGGLLARVEPAGAVVSLFVKDIFMPIKGDRARKASRRTIDECGFGPTFELLERFNARAEEDGVLDVRFVGAGEVDGRPTFVLERRLPYEGEGGRYPDCKLILHLDREWLLPVAIESYADESGATLLGRYVFTQVELNPGLSDQDFTF